MLNNLPVLIILCGLPASGKTTYARNLIATLHISSDAIREELYGDENIQGDPNEVFKIMKERTLEALAEGKSVVYDATNITRKSRASIIKECPPYVKICCDIVWQPIERCIELDARRERTVGKDVIWRMAKHFQAPFVDEGIHEINIILPTDIDVDDYFFGCVSKMRISHDNPHHTLPVDKHCLKAHNLINNKYPNDTSLRIAAAIHDIGKPFVKSFTDTKGNETDIAHYYQHQCVGAWISYALGNSYIAWLISSHMDMFSPTKYYKKLPPFLKKELDKLHEADINAH